MYRRGDSRVGVLRILQHVCGGESRRVAFRNRGGESADAGTAGVGRACRLQTVGRPTPRNDHTRELLAHGRSCRNQRHRRACRITAWCGTRCLPRTPNASFFLTFDWLETYWRHFGHDQKLRAARGLWGRRAARHLAAVRAAGKISREQGSRADVSARQLEHVVRPDRPEPGGHDVGRDAAHSPHAARLGHDRAALGGGRRRARRQDGPGDARGQHVQREAGISMDVARRPAGDAGRIPGRQIAIAAAAIPPYAARLVHGRAGVEYIRHRPLPASEGRRRPAVGFVRDVRIGRAGELAIARHQRQHAHARSRARILPRRP